MTSLLGGIPKNKVISGFSKNKAEWPLLMLPIIAFNKPYSANPGYILLHTVIYKLTSKLQQINSPSVTTLRGRSDSLGHNGNGNLPVL